jgi:hypothetical protein
MASYISTSGDGCEQIKNPTYVGKSSSERGGSSPRSCTSGDTERRGVFLAEVLIQVEYAEEAEHVGDDRAEADHHKAEHRPATAPPPNVVSVNDDADRQSERDQFGHRACDPQPHTVAVAGDNDQHGRERWRDECGSE